MGAIMFLLKYKGGVLMMLVYLHEKKHKPRMMWSFDSSHAEYSYESAVKNIIIQQTLDVGANGTFFISQSSKETLMVLIICLCLL